MGNGRTLTSIGTTPKIQIDRPGTHLTPGAGYFRIRFHSAQAVFDGGIWRTAEQLIITSRVDISAPPFADAPISAIHKVGRIRSGLAERVGLSNEIIELVPATMDSITLSIDFLVDTKNRFSPLLQVVNSGTFATVVSFAPGGAAVAKTLTGAAQAIAGELLAKEDQQPVLRFVGDLSVVTGDVTDSYIVILGSRSDRWPLPRPLPTPEQFEVRAGDLILEGRPVTQWSYVVLSIDTVPARTRDLGRAEAWYEKLNQVDIEIDDVANNPFSSDGERRVAWERSRELLRDASTLLLQSPVYLRTEARSIIRAAYAEAQDRLFGGGVGALGAPPGLGQADRILLDTGSAEEVRLDRDSYVPVAREAASKLRELELLA